MVSQECSDAILWIGQSYTRILCDYEPERFSGYCYIENNRKRRCYVHEAEVRGCCRKIPTVPRWLVPRKSRIFLMYRESNAVEQGSIFGYFALRRFEHIISEEVKRTIVNGERIPWIGDVCQEIISAVLEKIESEGIVEIKGRHRNLIEESAKKEFHKRWGKRVKERLDCITSRSRPVEAYQWPSDDDEIEDPLDDVLEDILEELIEEWLEELRVSRNPFRRVIADRNDDEEDDDNDEDDDDEDNIPVPRGGSQYEEPRYCSKRLKVGAIYAVDALAAAITDAFTQKLAKAHPVTIRDGEKLFRDTVKEVHRRYQVGTLTKLDPCIQEYATMRGELVVFKPPYPAFERRPRAEFRGLLRVDGKKLLDEIVEHYQKPSKKDVHSIPFGRAGRDDIFNAAVMAQEFGITKRAAESILTLYGKAMRSLKKGQHIVLPRIGTIRRRGNTFVFEPIKD